MRHSSASELERLAHLSSSNYVANLTCNLTVAVLFTQAIELPEALILRQHDLGGRRTSTARRGVRSQRERPSLSMPGTVSLRKVEKIFVPKSAANLLSATLQTSKTMTGAAKLDNDETSNLECQRKVS